MSFFGFFLLALFIWVAYNFVTKLVLPVYFTSKRIKEQFNNMRQQQGATPPFEGKNESNKQKPKEKVGEYIEFEEVP